MFPTVWCDRCQKMVPGYVGGPMSAGVYVVEGENNQWAKYANPGERIVCDQCMWKDPRYIAVYGNMGY